jgi:hypothetical protein
VAGTSDFEFDVFLSHSDKDDPLVCSIAERLRKDGLKVWLDDWMLKPGDSIPAKIDEGLEHSRVLVLCMSANAFGSDWSQLEAGTFRFRDPLNIERRFIPLRLDDAPIKGSLAQFAYIDWRPAADREREYTKLLAACRPTATPMTDGTRDAGKDAIRAPEGLTQEEPASASVDEVIVSIIGPLITAAIGATIGWLPGGLTGAAGAPLTVLLAAVGGISGLVFALMYKRYTGVLAAGGRAKSSPARRAYDQLRASLSEGNLPSRLYTDWLAKFLDAVDRFFGDAGMADRTLFPHAFGLKTPAPLWTPPAFDRCLLLALIYPIVTIFIIWAVSGHVGPAEDALDLRSDIAGWRRGLAMVAAAVSVLLLRSLRGKSRTENYIPAPWTVAGNSLGVLVCALVFAGALGGVGALELAVVLCLVGFTGIFVAANLAGGLGNLAIAGGLGTLAIAGAVALPIALMGVPTIRWVVDPRGAIPPLIVNGFWIIALVPVAISIAVAFILNKVAVQIRRQGVFLLLYLPSMIVTCFGAAALQTAGPLLVFLALPSLFNAPFDWASLGLTRALLRRGLELGGWWPYLLALVDALAAAFIITLLAITMVIGMQTFNHLAERSDDWAAHTLPLEKLFDGIAAQSSSPEYWWVYALLLSTMIPSLLNLMIGGASLLRGIPGLSTLLLHFMPASKAVPAFDRSWLALVLTCQVFVGAFLGIAAQVVLAIGVIFYVLPWMGLELLDTARVVAEYDLPMKVLRVWWGDNP